jgi:hypothetical protein
VSYYSLPNTRDFFSRRGFIGSCSCLQSCTGAAKPIPTVLSRHHHHQGASFIGVVVVDDALVALICRNVVVLREKL